MNLSTRCALATLLLLLTPSASVWAAPLFAAPPSEDGVTVVTEEPRITMDMGIRMVPSLEAGDSVKWWARRDSGWQRFMTARRMFPRAKSATIEIYLTALAEGFSKTLPVAPRTRFHFYVTDTLNPTLWPLGGGFFVLHSGLLRQMRDERQFAFLLALELAHEALGHNMVPVRLATDRRWDTGGWTESNFDSWAVEYWAHLVGRDPIESGGFTYSLQQESDALELVYNFFRANVWEYDGINRLVVDLLPTLNTIPGTSALARMHVNLAMAIKLPHARTKTELLPVEAVVNRATYAHAVHEIEGSTLQHYPWMLELVPYRDFVLERDINIDQVRKNYNEHADILSKRIETVRRKSRNTGLSTELDEFVERNDDLDGRDKLFSARLARTYLRGALLLAHHRWNDVITNAAEGLKLSVTAEPFLWQRALARQQLGQFNRCISELSFPWRHFDHRRSLLIVQCSFLEGRFTDAAKVAVEYRRKYPFDIEGAFWEMLTEIRLKRVVDKQIKDIELFWGDRPIVRAIKIFHYGYLGKFTEAQAAVDYRSDIPYLAQEWGVLAFAQAWLRESFNEFPGDDRADKLHQLAALQWPLAHLVRYNLPREPVQNR